ncbi:hypothetical protein BBO99_00001574 [Phytophthora kernoviae]|uniref:Uncharacterized protein n=1 Tax=Phytophthora kernoviae TaxID=325452 RepID=A0A3R7NL27_9STRA|nr:hypothetical protein BBI17_001792 [Phytophthora kernoviae]RLN84114.1 hypothetical protein BBO99_00001574 [Phytophthora kernoviae]
MQASAPIGARYAGRRAYMLVDNDELQTREEKETQTDLTTAAKTRFVTPRPILSNSEAAASSYALAFHNLRERIRSPALKHSLLIVLGHDPDKRRDEVDRRICEDAAAEALDGELRDFFDAVLAPVMQERETTLVNTMQDCIQHELQSQQFIVHNQEKRIAVLTQQVEDWEKQVTHLKAKVDRRVNENNALRKEQYRQLLMLRDIVSKQSSEPGALSALNEAIATVLAGKQEKLESETPRNGGDNDQNKAPGRGWGAGNANTQVLHREKEKWEQRAREANAECQELRDRIAHLTQENAKYRASVADPWFLNPENAIVERQRIAEAVCASQGSWEDVGDSLVELLNNDILWAAVEQSVRRGGTQGLARGLESMFAQLNGLAQSPSIDDDDVSDNDEVTATPPPARRRSAYADLGRLIPCRVCNGAGYIQTELGDNATNDADSYLRKTLEQVLELKKQLENANTKAFTLEGQLQLSHKETAELQEILQQAEFIKSSAVDSCLQTDLDTEEGIDIDEIMHSAYGDGTPTGQSFPRRNRRNSQYEHLIVELKSTLADKDEGLAESRKALDVAHSRAVTLQRALQKEKDSHAQELGMLKTSLAFSLKTRNTKIEERQAAVKLLLKKFSKKQQPLTIPKNISALAPMDESPGEDNDEASTEQNESGSTVQNIASYEPNNEQPEVRRMETLVQRYAEDIIRVRKEHEIQQELLKKAEAHIAEEDEKRSRTNSISQGSLVVNLASHPRDLFKALTTAQGAVHITQEEPSRARVLEAGGAEVPVVDIASEKPGDNNAEMSTSNPALYSSNTTTSPRTRNEPQDAPSLESEDDHFQYETGIPLLDDSNNIERDPEVIEQLRLLINQSSATKENLAITGWKILVCRILSLWDLQRLDRMKKIADKQAKVQSDGKARVESRKSSDMRGAMQKRVQLREKSLQDATSTQEILRKERKKAQAHVRQAANSNSHRVHAADESEPKWQANDAFDMANR